MLPAHITSFLNLINAQLEETSRGISSNHHFHNVQCGIANILSLLKYSNDVGEKAAQLSRTASKYIAGHAVISSKITEGDITADADRLNAAREALAGFRFAVEHSQPNARVRTLGLPFPSPCTNVANQSPAAILKQKARPERQQHASSDYDTNPQA
jgi:hypothetical protein